MYMCIIERAYNLFFFFGSSRWLLSSLFRACRRGEGRVFNDQVTFLILLFSGVPG